MIMALPAQHLWRKVFGSSAETESQLVLVYPRCQAEISQKQVPILVKQNVLRLEVAINYFLLVQVAQGYGYLGNHELSLVLGKPAYFDKVAKELAALYEIHEEVYSGLVAEHVVHGNDEGVLRFIKDFFF